MSLPGDTLMPSAIVVRALWGNPSIAIRGKAYEDVALAEEWRRNLRLIEQRVVAYGEHNAEIVRRFSYKPIILPDEVPEGWRGTRGASDPYGRWENGLSMWWRKLWAIKAAWETLPRPDVILWLDWDTKILRTINQKFIRVANRGPAFQGRLRAYRRRQCQWRKRDSWAVYFGGCYFMSSPRFLDRAIAVSHRHPWLNDEQVVTKAVDEILRGRSDSEYHRARGFDNPRLCSTCNDALPSEQDSAMREGRRMNMKGRLKRTANLGD